MKTQIATALSLIGVLGAGSAAALVNTQILDSGPRDATTSAAVLPEATAVPLTIPATAPVTLPTTLPSTVPSSTMPTTVPAPAPAPAPTGYLTSYTVGEAAVVIVDVVNGQVVLVEAAPTPGWTMSDVEEDGDSNKVEAKFTNATTMVLVEFEVALVDGQLVPHVESKSLATGSTDGSSSGSPSTTATRTTIDDDDDDDDGDDHGGDHDDDDDHGGDDDRDDD